MKKRHRFAILRRRLRRFLGDARAAAAVEFALILPPLLLLYVGSIEASSLITVDRRLHIVSGAVGDLIARWDPEAGAIPQATLDDYFDASEVIMFPYLDTTLTQRVSMLSVDEDGDATVLWSCGNGAYEFPSGTDYALDPEMTTLAQNASGYVVAAETLYDYTPVLGIVIQEIFLHAKSFYLPRFELVVNGPSGC